MRNSAEPAVLVGYCSLILLPCYILGNALSTIWNPRPRTINPINPPTGLTPSDLTDIWEKHQDVQMHFNGIELQIRNYAVTLLVAVTGAAAYAFKTDLNLNLGGHTYSMALAVLPAGILGWSAFYFMDRLWYHKLLLGAVYQTLALEKLLPELELSHAIGDESPIRVGTKGIHSTEKIDLFYTAGLIFLILITGIVLWQGLGSSPPTPGTSGTQAAPSDPRSCPGPEKQIAPPGPEIDKHDRNEVQPQKSRTDKKQKQEQKQKAEACCCCCKHGHLKQPESNP